MALLKQNVHIRQDFTSRNVALDILDNLVAFVSSPKLSLLFWLDDDYFKTISDITLFSVKPVRHVV